MRRHFPLLLPVLTAAIFAATLHAQVNPPPLPPPVKPEKETPPPLPPAPEVEIYLGLDGAQAGPFTPAEVARMAAEGKVKPDTLAWKAGTKDWVPAENLAELKNAFTDQPPPMPKGEKFKQYLIGSWQIQRQENSPGGAYLQTWSTRYAEDGTYQGSITIEMIGSGLQPAVTAVEGTWKVTPGTKPDEFTLTATPKVRGSGGGTAEMRIIDENTVEDKTAGVQAVRITE